MKIKKRITARRRRKAHERYLRERERQQDLAEHTDERMKDVTRVGIGVGTHIP